MNVRQGAKPGVLEGRSSPLWGALLFVVLGLLIASTAILVDSGRNPTPAIIAGASIAAFGSVIVAARAGWIIDLNGGSLVTWWGVLIPFARTQLALARVRQVTLAGARKSGIPIQLDLRDSANPIELNTASSYSEAQAAAVQIARLLGIPVHDEVLPWPPFPEVVRSVQTLGVPALARWSAGQEPLVFPQRPAAMEAQVFVHAGTLILEVARSSQRGGERVIVSGEGIGVQFTDRPQILMRGPWFFPASCIEVLVLDDGPVLEKSRMAQYHQQYSRYPGYVATLQRQGGFGRRWQDRCGGIVVIGGGVRQAFCLGAPVHEARFLHAMVRLALIGRAGELRGFPAPPPGDPLQR